MIPENVHTLLDEWQAWGITQAPKLIRRLSGGFNNHAYLIRNVQSNYVLKVFSAPSPANGHAQTLAAAQGLAPALLYCSPLGDYCVMPYLATPLHNRASPDVPKLLAASLAKLHSLDTVDRARLDYFAFCEAYLSKLDSFYANFHTQLLPALNYFIGDTNIDCLSHNDLVKENCFVENKRALFIDWDYAAPNNPWFDLAAVIYYFDMTPSQSLELSNSYWALRGNGSSSNHIAQIRNAALCAVIWLDILWFAERSIESDIPLDKNSERVKIKALNQALTAFAANS